MIRPAGGTPGDHKDQNQAIGWIWQDGYERDWLSGGWPSGGSLILNTSSAGIARARGTRTMTQPSLNIPCRATLSGLWRGRASRPSYPRKGRTGAQSTRCTRC